MIENFSPLFEAMLGLSAAPIIPAVYRSITGMLEEDSEIARGITAKLQSLYKIISEEPISAVFDKTKKGKCTRTFVAASILLHPLLSRRFRFLAFSKSPFFMSAFYSVIMLGASCMVANDPAFEDAYFKNFVIIFSLSSFIISVLFAFLNRNEKKIGLMYGLLAVAILYFVATYLRNEPYARLTEMVPFLGKDRTILGIMLLAGFAGYIIYVINITLTNIVLYWRKMHYRKLNTCVTKMTKEKVHKTFTDENIPAAAMTAVPAPAPATSPSSGV